MNTEQVEVTEVEVKDTDTNVSGFPELDPAKITEWQRVKGLITDAQVKLVSFFDKLEEELGNSIIIESVDIDRTKRSPVSRYTWDSSDVKKFEAKYPEAKAVFTNRIDTVTLVISVDKEVS